MVVSNLLYADFHMIDLSHIRDLLKTGRLSPRLTEKLLSYWELRLQDSRDPIFHEYIEYYIFFESVRAGILNVLFFDISTGKIMHNYGIFSSAGPGILRHITATPNLPEISRYVILEESYNLWIEKVDYLKKQYIIAAVFPEGHEIREHMRRMSLVFRRYYLPGVFENDDRYNNAFSHAEEEILKKIKPVLQMGQPVTFSRFVFEPLEKYVKLAGENFAQELVNELYMEITEKLKHDDKCYVLSPREYVIVSVNCEKEIMEKRFYRAAFHSKSLLLSYKSDFLEFRKPVADLSVVWQNLNS